MSRVAVVDVGTTNIKAGVVDPSGRIRREITREMTPRSPERGAAEHDPEKLLDVFETLLGELAADQEPPLEALGLTGYVFGFLPLDDSGEPLMGMMTPLDERPKNIMNELEERLPYETIYQKTGCPPLFLYPLARCLWLREKNPEMFAKTRWFAGLTSFLCRHLIDRFCTEPSMASATQFYNTHNHEWDPDILSLAGIEPEQLPEIVPGNVAAGTVRRSVTRRLGLRRDVKLLPGLYDSASMILAMGAHQETAGTVNLGTTTMMRVVTPDPILDDPAEMRLQTYCLFRDRWLLGAGLNNAGLVLRWYRDQCTELRDYDSIIERASAVDPGSDGLFCLPYLTGERDPRIGEESSGVFFGLKSFHESPHLSRSILEGVGYTLNMIREAIEERGPRIQEIRIGGAGTKTDLWPRILSNVLNVSVRKTNSEDTTLVGVAMLAYVALGAHGSLEEATREMVHLGDPFEPDEQTVARYRNGYSFFRELVDTMPRLFKRHQREFLDG